MVTIMGVILLKPAMKTLQYEGKIKYNSTIEGYELCNQ